jgi:peptidoglycan/xylan/chitin deacetylase (PgdA/CDA1 family)
VSRTALRAVALLAAPALALALAGCGGGGAGRAHASATRAPAATARTRKPPARPPAARATVPARPHGSHHGPVPILMYHVVGVPPAGAPYPALFVAPELFAAQMYALRRAGWTAVTLEEAYRSWHGGPGLPRRALVVSFDDGYSGQSTHAARTLRALGWPGVLDLEVHNLHVAGGLHALQVERMLAAGWELASHTLTHPDLTTVDPARLRRELAGSRALLRREFHAPVRFFCYPAGRYDARVEAAVRAAGYAGATTEVPGAASSASDPYALPRVRVNGGESPAAVLAAVAGH